MALASLGIIELVQNLSDFESRESAATYFERAFNANPRNPIALKYLADHYFFKGGENGFALATDLATAGLSVLKHKTKPERSEISSFRADIDLLRSNFYFILGKV